MADITITHTMEDGTILTGSTKGDGVWEIARAHGFTYRPNPGIFIRGSRDHKPRTWKIEAAKQALEAAGHTVTLNLETELRSPEEREAALAERLEARQETLADKAERLAAQGSADYQRARQMADAIPFGQPMMPDHYSYRRDRNYRNRISRTYERAFETLDAAKETARRAKASEVNLAHRYDPGVIQRRLDKLAADERRWLRDLDGGPSQVEEPPGSGNWRWIWVKPTGGYRQRVLSGLAETQAEILYWRGELQAQEAAGVKVWGPGDFTKGDQVLDSRGDWQPVLRVNKKSVTVPHWIDGYTDTLPYDKVRGRRPDDYEEAV